jgi:hypothetical protein
MTIGDWLVGNLNSLYELRCRKVIKRNFKVGFFALTKTAIVVGLMFTLTACASQPLSYDGHNPPGFFFGFWNGLTIFFSLIGHLFDNSIRIYAFPNNGGWYDLGFFLGVGVLGGGASSAGR